MESALNSTIVLLEQYVGSISHNLYETIIEFSARLPQEREEVINGQRPTTNVQVGANGSDFSSLSNGKRCMNLD
ncbi:MAG: hypothetical protein QGH15_11615 [Kiritimatiellia bacterium]|jgi:hypothetical protein|nr:hypothetical protein [Kiritimatiellia bacterium]